MFCPFAGAALGEVQQDLNFVGFSIGNNGVFPTYFAIDGKVMKSTGEGDIETGTQTIYYFWDWPYLVDELTVSATYMIAGDYRIVSGTWYGATMNGWNNCSLTNLGSAVMSSGKHDTVSTQNSVYQKILGGSYMYLVLAVTPDSSGENILHRAYSYTFLGHQKEDVLYGNVVSKNEIMAAAFASVRYGNDDGLKASIDNQTQVIQKEQDETQQTIKDETEKQTSAIGGFFDKLLGGIKDFFTGLFIPDEIATDAFTDLLEQKLGFIYQVPAIVVSFFTTLFGAFASGQASSITFPGWSYGEWTFLEPATISRSDYSAIFGVLDPILTIVGTILVVFAFCKGVQSFYERIIGGGKE